MATSASRWCRFLIMCAPKWPSAISGSSIQEKRRSFAAPAFDSSANCYIHNYISFLRRTPANPITSVNQRSAELPGKSFRRPGFCLSRFLISVFRRSIRFQRTEQLDRDGRNVTDRTQEQRFIRFGWFVEACDFPHELQCRRPSFFLGNRRIEVEQRFDVSAHWYIPSCRQF
jgi:hypothetical protein